MNAKTRCERRAGRDLPAGRRSTTGSAQARARVILPITDPYVVHHGALGSFATVYLPTAATTAAMRGAAAPRCAASSSVLTRARGLRRASSCRPTASATSSSSPSGTTVLGTARVAPRSVGARRAAALARRHLRAARAAARQPQAARTSTRRAAGATSTSSTSRSTMWRHERSIDDIAARSACASPARSVGTTRRRAHRGAQPVHRRRGRHACRKATRRAGAPGLRDRPAPTSRSSRATSARSILHQDRRAAARAQRRARRPDHRRVGPLHEGLALRGRPRLRRVRLRGPAQRLQDDGQIFSCDLTPHGKPRKVYTQREPLLGVISAITPFNHPLNQVAHKVAPSIATNNRMVLKPTEKTPLSALLLADMLYEAGLPPRDALGRHRRPARDRRRDDHQSRRRPRHLHRRRRRSASTSPPRPATSGMVLELGGNDPLIVMEDADLDEAADARRRRLVQELRPALHGGQAHARAREGRRRASSSALVAKTKALDATAIRWTPSSTWAP